MDPQIVEWGREQIMSMSPLNAWFKLPAALADLLNGWLILRMLQPLVGDLKARAGAALYLFNPQFLYDSVYWGQMDGLLLTFMLLVVQQVWGLILVGVVQVAIGLTLWRRRDPQSFFLGAALSVGAFFLFMTRMHERYFIPALVATILDPRLRRDYWALCSISILNLLYAQDPHIASLFDARGITTILSMANLGLFSRLLWQFITGPTERNEAEMAKEGAAACVS